MEYLMTYGWAIVAIGVVIAVFYSLGIFGLGSNISTGCAVIEGFSCSKPVLYSSGTLTADIGQVGVTKMITATGCSQNSTAPSTWNFTSITLASGQTSGASFLCPWVAGLPIGTPVTATLWVQYSTSTQSGSITITQQVAEIRTTVQAVGVPGLSSGMLYAPVTLTNNQGSATGSNFQQEVIVPSSFSQYESADLGNIRFYQGGTELYSWCESSCAEGYDALFWVNLKNGIAANSNTVIYMVLENSISVDYDGVYAGECPTCSPSYGQYDNGNSVFTFYDNFYSPTCQNYQFNPASYNVVAYSGMGGPTEISRCNRLDEISSPNDYSYGGLISAVPYPTPFIFEAYEVYNYGGGIGFQSGPDGASNGYTFFNGPYGHLSVAWQSMENLPSDFYSNNPSPAVSTAEFGLIGGAWTSSSSQVWYNNYVPTAGSATSGPLPSSLYFSVGLYDPTAGASVQYVQWIRVRAYPPNGQIPSYSFGSVANT